MNTAPVTSALAAVTRLARTHRRPATKYRPGRDPGRSCGGCGAQAFEACGQVCVR